MRMDSEISVTMTLTEMVRVNVGVWGQKGEETGYEDQHEDGF